MGEYEHTNIQTHRKEQTHTYTHTQSVKRPGVSRVVTRTAGHLASAHLFHDHHDHSCITWGRRSLPCPRTRRCSPLKHPLSPKHGPIPPTQPTDTPQVPIPSLHAYHLVPGQSFQHKPSPYPFLKPQYHFLILTSAMFPNPHPSSPSQPASRRTQLAVYRKENLHTRELF